MTWRRMVFLWLVWSLAGSVVVVPVAWTIATIATTPGPQSPATGFSPRQTKEPLPPLTTKVSPEPPDPPPPPARTRTVPAPRLTIIPVPETTPPLAEPGAETEITTSPAVHPADCTEAREAGLVDILRGDPAYRIELDQDDDGLACESSDETTTAVPTTEETAAPTIDPPVIEVEITP